jgi:hypothetical protein
MSIGFDPTVRNVDDWQDQVFQNTGLRGKKNSTVCVKVSEKCMNFPEKGQLHQLAQWGVNESQVLLEGASKALSPSPNDLAPMVRNMARLYFGLEAVTEQNLKDMRRIVSKIWTGLASNVTIGIAEEVTANKDHGVVHLSPVEGSPKTGFTHQTVPVGKDETVVMSTKEKTYYKTGNIYMQRAVFGNNPNKVPYMALVTLLHEASHKYAGTWDYYAHLFGGPEQELKQYFTSQERVVGKSGDFYGYRNAPDHGKDKRTAQPFDRKTRQFKPHSEAQPETVQSLRLLQNGDSWGWFIYCAPKSVEELITAEVCTGGQNARQQWGSVKYPPWWATA